MRRILRRTGSAQLQCTLSSTLARLTTRVSSSADAVISASWDATVRVTPLSSSDSSLVLPVADKVYSLALSQTKIVVAMGARQNWIYDIATIKTALNDKVTDGKEVQVWQKRESSLKFMTRAVKAMPNDQGS